MLGTDVSEERLISIAQEAALMAHAPYSNFHVGAALLCADGTIFKGCNVECSSFGGTICAERSALAQAVSHGRKEFLAIAVFTQTDRPTTPCGICRQILLDFSPQMKVVCACPTGREIHLLHHLLPHAFSASQLPNP